MSEVRGESRSSKRARFIEYIYGFELMGEPFSHIQAFESGDFSDAELKMIEAIEKNYARFSKLAASYLNQNWSWERIAPLERAILIFGAFELTFGEKKNVINELISYTRGFIPGENYKFINVVLDKIGAYYEQVKTNKSAN